MLITQQGQTLRMKATDVRVIGRATQGVRLIGVAEGDQVVSIVRLEDQGDDAVDPNAASGATPESPADVTPPTGDDEPTD
jgi:DNA gyrase subunit A